VKYVPENEHLLVKNTVFVNDKKNVKSEVTDYIIQRPNQFVLGVPFPLHIYNLGDDNFEDNYKEWKLNHPKKAKRNTALFSEKQSRAIYRTKYKRNQWLFKTGEAPVILDNSKTKQTIASLRQHYLNEGYFNAQVTSENIEGKNQKVQVNYLIETNKPYIIDSYGTQIDSKILDSIYNISQEKSIVKAGNQYKLSSFINEQTRITELFRNSGVYRFNKNAITFEADSTNYKSNIELLINDSIVNVPFKVQKIKNITIYTDYSFQTKDEPIKDSVTYNGYKFLAQKDLKYNPKYLLNSVFIEPNTLYQDKTRELTRKGMRSLNNFRTVDIRYTEIENDELEASIYLTPLKKYAIGFNTELTHSNARPIGTLAKITFLDRNIFRGAEIFKFSVQGSFMNSKDAADQESLFNAWEVGADISLELPRFLLPIKQEKIVSKSRTPRTSFTLGTSLQKNVGLDKQKLTGIIDYTWEGSEKINHSFQIFNTQFIKNLNPDQYFYVYTYEYGELEEVQQTHFPDYPLTEDNAIEFIEENITPEFGLENPVDYVTAKNIEARYYIITENAFIPSIAYTFTYNSRESYKDNNFHFFKGRVSLAGSLATAISSETDSTGVKTFLDTPISQFVKTDLEYKKFWSVSVANALAFRFFAGVAIPFGNSETIPFTRSYFIGGPNDLRAWKIYDLGPGASRAGLEYNVGSLKLLTSFEYRFNVINSFKGALFVDAGNIWDITNSTLTPPASKFTGFESLKNVGIGSGFGLRYDLSFILIRLDIGFKTYEPYNFEGEKWFKNYNFANAVYNFGISYPF